VLLAASFFLGGLALLIYFGERAVGAVVRASHAFGHSAFVVSVVFLGFDPENLAVGAAGAAEGVAGIALGSIIGAAMVAVGLALGLTALTVGLRFESVPRRVALIPLLAVACFGLLVVDGSLSRLDGSILLGAFAFSLLYLMRLPRGALLAASAGREDEAALTPQAGSRLRALALLAVCLFGVVVGGEMVVFGSKRLIVLLGLSDTVFGMTVLALAVSAEELARELPAALRGRPDITVGNVVGSVLAFFLFNAGVIAVVRPVAVAESVLRFYFPACLGTVGLVSLFLAARGIPRWAGGLLALAYAGFVLGGARLYS
jgi:cation:H+ antiporter